MGGLLVQTVPELVSVLALEEREQVSPPPAPAVTTEFYFLFTCFGLCVCLVFATNFRVKAAMKNSVLLSWEVRDKNPAPPFTVSQTK